nr:hypothetical protein [Ktedonobacteraceae bacterium]
MYRIIMDVLCLEGYSEVLPGNVENTELVIEDLVALILLDLFGVVAVDGVNVTCSPATANQQASCWLRVQASCATEETTMPEASLEMLEARLENSIGCALIELFGTVLINKLIVRYERVTVSEPVVLSRSA